METVYVGIKSHDGYDEEIVCICTTKEKFYDLLKLMTVNDVLYIKTEYGWHNFEIREYKLNEVGL
jgi:hypothetical protein